MKSWDVRIGAFRLLLLLLGCIAAAANEEGDSFNSARFKRQQGERLWHTDGLWNELGIPQFWQQYKNGPFGVVIRGWQFSRCASELWTDYKVNVTNITLWPQFPRFPGPLFFNVSLAISEPLPTDRIEMELEVRHAVVTKSGRRGWQVIPCQGWDLPTGCDGIGSCRYCNILDRCYKLVKTGEKYTDNKKVQEFLTMPQKLCPPPVGSWTMTFSQVFQIQDIPKGFFGPLQSNEYWLTFTFTNGRGEKLACARLWIDVCKYNLYDRYQRCLKDPNAFESFIRTISDQTELLRSRG